MSAALLDARTALVTGGGAGIGGAIARRFAAEGARVLLVEIDAARAAQTAQQIEAAGGTVCTLVGDVRDGDVVKRALGAALEFGSGRIDVLVNNVGDYRPAGLFAESEEQDWEELYAINLRHVLRFTRAVLPGMLAQGRGAIVNVSTVEAFRGIPANSVYSAFKAGVSQFTKSLAVEVGNHGVRVNAIAPDVTDTPQTPYHRWLDADDRAKIPSWVPVGRIAQAEEIADVALFLACDLSRFVTGHTIPADGGTLAAGGWYKRLRGERWTNRPKDP